MYGQKKPRPLLVSLIFALILVVIYIVVWGQAGFWGRYKVYSDLRKKYPELDTQRLDIRAYDSAEFRAEENPLPWEMRLMDFGFYQTLFPEDYEILQDGRDFLVGKAEPLEFFLDRAYFYDEIAELPQRPDIFLTAEKLEEIDTMSYVHDDKIKEMTKPEFQAYISKLTSKGEAIEKEVVFYTFDQGDWSGVIVIRPGQKAIMIWLKISAPERIHEIVLRTADEEAFQFARGLTAEMIEHYQFQQAPDETTLSTETLTMIQEPQ
ncbi:MAG: hypothetical protein ACLFUS_16485 [Candidatus Sumerlaeia bacterium]